MFQGSSFGAVVGVDKFENMKDSKLGISEFPAGFQPSGSILGFFLLYKKVDFPGSYCEEVFKIYGWSYMAGHG